MSSALMRLLCVLFALTVGQAFAAPPTVEEFFAFPRFQSMSLSPSGRYLATIQGVDDQRVVAVYDTENAQRVSVIPSGKAKIFGVSWFSDDRMVIEGAILKEEAIPGRNIVYNDRRAIVMNRDGSKPIAFIFTGRILTVKGPEPETVLVVASNFAQGRDKSAFKMGEKPSTNIWSVNINTGEFKVVEKGNQATFDWLIDKTGTPRIRVESDGRKTSYFARLEGSKDWVQVGGGSLLEVEEDQANSKQSLSFQGFGDNLNEAYVEINDTNTKTLGVYDLTQRRVVRNVIADAKWDATGFIRQRDARVVGGTINRWYTENEYFTPDWQKIQRDVQAAFPGYRFQITSASDDKTKVTVYLEGPDAPSGAYQFVDFTRGDGFVVGERHPGLSRGRVGIRSTVTYKARDGVDIDAYVTLPPGSAGKNLAAIVMPHGGPEARDDGEFDSWAHFFASRGYAVIQPQFRGSDGYGRKFREIARFQWGLTMQDDVSDAVKHLVDQGIADPKRVCIFGWSYGGYAAMTGAALTPELYRCSIAGAGVSDLIKILDTQVGSNSNNFAFRYWRRVIGNVRDDLPRLIKTSAARNADKVAAPMLLIHGTLDTVVLPEQSQFMADALTAAKKPFEYVKLEGEDHNLSFLKTRVQAFKAMEEFLNKHNPAN